MSLNDYNNEELQEELEKRKKVNIPVPKAVDMDFDDLLAALRSYLEVIILDDYPDLSNEKNNIFEMAFEAFYGPTIWDWIKEQIKG